VRDEQADYERIYFVRVVASHLREIAKLVVLDHRERSDVREFVRSLPADGRQARAEAERLLHATLSLRTDTQLWEDMKRIRDDTFHYARDEASQGRLQAAMRAVAGMRGAYVLDERGWLRADYADLVASNRMHPFEEGTI
jgi:hypothetical protein